jgi:hypothetical protein
LQIRSRNAESNKVSLFFFSLPWNSKKEEMGRRRRESGNFSDGDVRKRLGILLLFTKVSVVVVSGNRKMRKMNSLRNMSIKKGMAANNSGEGTQRVRGEIMQ